MNQSGTRIGVVDADLLDGGTRHPNLALMKISSYYKSIGYNVNLVLDYDGLHLYDKVFISKVFTFTRVPDSILNKDNVIIGGTGFYPDGGENLPYKIEHSMPDYSLYDDYVQQKLDSGVSKSKLIDYIDFSIGFATRGCFRKCDFCVNKKYDKVVRHSSLNEFVDVTRKKIYLWDDNILGFSNWRDVFDELKEVGKPFQFRQGMDIRLMTDEKAEVISKSKYYGDFIFAFDHIKDKTLIEEKLKLWRSYSKKGTKLYILCAYDSTNVEDIISVFERIKILIRHGCVPYIMRYESYKDSEMRGMYTQLARWCNQQQFFKKTSFREFCEANQRLHKNPNTTCSAYRVMIEFEREFPKVAMEYFDMKYSTINEFCAKTEK